MKFALAIATGTLGLMAVGVLASPYAMAEEAGWYGGANIGRSGATINNQKITNDLSSGGLSTSSITNDDRDTGYKIFGGYQLDKNFSLEGGYFDLGQFGFTATTSPAGTLNGNIKVRGLNLDLVGLLPITDKFSAFGRGGVIYSQARDSFSGTGSVTVSNPNPSKSDIGYKFGVGMQYAFTEKLAMRTEVERYRINDAVGNKGDVDLISVGLVYRFGAKSPTYVPRAAAPEPVREVIAVAPAPVIVPPVVVQPPPPRFERYTLTATELFGFNSAELQMPQPKLDEIVAVLRKESDINNVVISGNADRIGSPEYNQTLSENRADAVKDYLVSKGIDPTRMTAEGKGEADPVVVCTDKNRTALIKCLGPNRRVDVEHVTIQRRVQ